MASKAMMWIYLFFKVFEVCEHMLKWAALYLGEKLVGLIQSIVKGAVY